MKKFLHGTGCLAVCVALCGCATVFEGTSQDISVVSNPSGAYCVFNREGMEVGRIQSTPGTTSIRKSKYDVTIRCSKPGYAEATYLNHSGTTATIAANIAADIILTAGLSSIVDSADGADNKYDSVVNLSMVPTLTPAMAAVVGAPLESYRTATSIVYPVQRAAAGCSTEAIESARVARESGFIFNSGC